MNFENIVIDPTTFYSSALGSGVVAAILALSALVLVIVLALYVYTSFAFSKIAQKTKYKYRWLAWIPIANMAMWFQMAGVHWAWIFLILIPFLGWLAVLGFFTFASWKVFEKLHYPGWLSLSIPLMVIPRVESIGLIAYLIIIGIIAWKK